MAVSFLAWALAGVDGWPVDAIVIAVVLVLAACLSGRSDGALRPNR